MPKLCLGEQSPSTRRATPPHLKINPFNLQPPQLHASPPIEIHDPIATPVFSTSCPPSLSPPNPPHDPSPISPVIDPCIASIHAHEIMSQNDSRSNLSQDIIIPQTAGPPAPIPSLLEACQQTPLNMPRSTASKSPLSCNPPAPNSTNASKKPAPEFPSSQESQTAKAVETTIDKRLALTTRNFIAETPRPRRESGGESAGSILVTSYGRSEGRYMPKSVDGRLRTENRNEIVPTPMHAHMDRKGGIVQRRLSLGGPTPVHGGEEERDAGVESSGRTYGSGGMLSNHVALSIQSVFASSQSDASPELTGSCTGRGLRGGSAQRALTFGADDLAAVPDVVAHEESEHGVLPGEIAVSVDGDGDLLAGTGSNDWNDGADRIAETEEVEHADGIVVSVESGGEILAGGGSKIRDVGIIAETEQVEHVEKEVVLDDDSDRNVVGDEEWNEEEDEDKEGDILDCEEMNGRHGARSLLDESVQDYYYTEVLDVAAEKDLKVRKDEITVSKFRCDETKGQIEEGWTNSEGSCTSTEPPSPVRIDKDETRDGLEEDDADESEEEGVKRDAVFCRSILVCIPAGGLCSPSGSPEARREM